MAGEGEGEEIMKFFLLGGPRHAQVFELPSNMLTMTITKPNTSPLGTPIIGHYVCEMLNAQTETEEWVPIMRWDGWSDGSDEPQRITSP